MAFWHLPSANKSLFLAANTNYQSVSLVLTVADNTVQTEILNAGVTSARNGSGELTLNLNATATTGWIFEGDVSVKTVSLL